MLCHIQQNVSNKLFVSASSIVHLQSLTLRSVGGFALNRAQMRFYTDDAQIEDERILPVYVHHVSKIVLQHLQGSRSRWIVDQGLDRGLHIKSNGTFLLRFPARKGYDSGKIW